MTITKSKEWAALKKALAELKLFHFRESGKVKATDREWHQGALDTLRYVRNTMDRIESGDLTVIPNGS